jgi:hypothetical protein
MAATTKVYAFDGAGPTGHDVTAGTGTVSFSRADAYNDTASQITIPTGNTRRFSYLRYLALYVTAGGGSTTLSNLRVKLAGSIRPLAWSCTRRHRARRPTHRTRDRKGRARATIPPTIA